MTREEITALAESHARNTGLTEGSPAWYYAVMKFEVLIETDLEILHDMFAGPVYVPPLHGAVDLSVPKRRRYWKKVKFTDGS